MEVRSEQERTFEIKTVDFYGDSLMAVKDESTGKIYTGVSYICKGIGLTKSQKDTQVQNIQTDLILNRGCLKFQAGVIDPNNHTLGIEIEYIPMWLAKISITPLMQEKQPDVTEKLIRYQLKAKDVLAEAFLNQPSYMIEDEIERAKVWIKEQEQKQLLEKENKQHKQMIEQSKPKVIFADAVSTSKTCILVGELAKILKQNGVDTGQNRFFEWLRVNGYLVSRKGTDYNMPTQKSMELDLFEVKETSVTHSDGHISLNKTPKVTGKGQQYFINKLLQESNKASC